MRTGLVLAGAAYTWWGVVIPGYMHLMKASGAYELLAMRILWGVPVMLAIVAYRRQLRELRHAFTDWSVLKALLISTPLIAVNWYAFTYSIVEGRLLESSLGYYINPIVSVALGTIVLGERLRPAQWVAVALAAGAVTALTWANGSLPLITVTVALTFGLYGLVRKRAKAGPVIGLAVEMILLAPLLLAVELWLVMQGRALYGTDATTTVLLSLGGVVTVVPLLCFVAATRKLRLSTVGLMQYISPTMQLIFAATVMGQELDQKRLIAFGIIWVGLIVFSADSLLAHQRRPRTPLVVNTPDR